MYKITQTFPNEEKFGLVSQLRRASVSIVANFAEGYGRNSIKERIRFLSISKGSLFEVDGLLIISNELKFLSNEDFDRMSILISNCIRMSNGLINYFERNA